MKLIRIVLIGLLALPLASAASKEILELQRDVALLQQQVKDLQSSQDQKIATLQTLTQQTLDTVNRLNTSLALLGNNIESNANKTTPAVAGLNGRLDQVTQSFNDLRDNVQDIGARIGKIDAAIADLKNTVNLAAHPAPPPAGANVNPEAPQGAAQGGAPASGPPAGMSAEQSYSNAYRDYGGGQLDLALQEFQDYLQYFPTTQFAPNAQFYIGDILYHKGSYDKAVAAFDAVNEKYQANAKTSDAHYMKGLALVKMGRRDAAAKEFREVIARSSNPELVARAKKQMQDMGLSTGTPARRKTRR
ncbi:MAG: tetratricopeptide repeat protein [Bryobacteraceae bacterium]|jgi:TolA-binding protein